MDKKYTHYTIDDLLSDDNFISSVLHPTPESEEFWIYLIQKGYVLADDFEKASLFIRAIQSPKEKLFRKEKDLLWEKIEIENKKNLVNFFDGITGLMQMLIFFLLGLLSFPSKLPHVIVPALLIFMCLTFVARPLSVALVLTPFRSKIKQLLLVSWSGLRGAASIVFSIMAYTATNDDLDTFHIIFMIVLFSILLQGSMLPWISRKLDMLDKTADVMKTFNDYSEEADIQFIQLTIPENHLWCGHKLKDLTLPPETLIVLIRRGEQNIIPDGETIILQNDVLVLSAITPDEVHGIRLVEKIIEKDSRYNNKLLSEISKKHNEIIIMIQRNGQVIIPNGNVRLTTGDILVINRAVN